MSVNICLLRGVNVGGRNRLAMADLRAALSDLGAEQVATYIQSGNAVFRGVVTEEAITAAVKTVAGFAPLSLVLPLDRYERILSANPFPGQDAVHVWFLAGPSAPLAPEVAALAANGEAVAVSDGAAWLLAPAGIGRSKLATRLERALGVPATARNWRTAQKLREMGRALDVRDAGP